MHHNVCVNGYVIKRLSDVLTLYLSNEMVNDVLTLSTPKGTTPKTLRGVSAGNHTIKLSKSEYKDSTRTPSVKAGETISINATRIPSLKPVGIRKD